MKKGYNMKKKKTIVYIAPHLSTGGMPQYLFKQIQSVINDFDVYCIEWDNVTGGVLVVQRNRIQNILGDKLITLGQDKEELFSVLDRIKPDVIHLQEIPEMFLPRHIADRLYNAPRPYVIIETSHDSGYDISNKTHLPDKFLMVSNYQVQLYKKLGIPCELVEYPIEYKVRTKTREQAIAALGLDPNVKHVVNVGLFTPRKNQAEILEYARILQNYPIHFHFVGNQADNFKFYWEPLMQNFPKNCTWWGERSDVDTFYEMADLFLFTSRGHSTDMETMPLVLRESLGWRVPTMMYNLPVYMGYFDKYDTIEYLKEDMTQNAYRIAEKLHRTFRPSDKDFNVYFVSGENKLHIDYKGAQSFHTKVVIKDKDSNAPIYWTAMTLDQGINYWIMPVPLDIFDFANDPSFSAFLVEFYDEHNTLILSREVFVKPATVKRTVQLDIKTPFDCLFNNYNEMFVERKYDCYELNDLDVVLDIGANNGLFTLLMLQSGCRKVYAFEPNKDSLVNLTHMFANNDKVAIVEKAVYINDSDLEFFIDPNNTTIGSLSESHLQTHGSSVQKITVPAISLKSFMKEHGVDRISLVKMDIEGAEYDIIEHLEDEVYDKVDSFLIEYHDNTDRRVVRLLDILKSKGYDIVQIRNQNSKTNEEMTYTYETSPIGTFLAKKTPKEKLLTVIIPTYNHAQYVRDSINSILKQKTLFNFDVLISDDNSQDGTYDIIKEYKNVRNVRIHQTPVNEGPTPKRVANLLKLVNSKYVTFLDADDYYTNEHKLQKQVEFLEAHPEYSVHSTGWFHTGEELLTYNAGYDGSVNRDMIATETEVTLQNNIDSNYVGFGFMFRNHHIAGKDLPEWFYDEDVFDGYWAIINVMLAYGNAKNEEWVGGRYRITPTGHFGCRDASWKQEQVQKQSIVFRKTLQTKQKPILIVDAFFHDAHCLDTFTAYLEQVKKMDIPIMLVTNSKFDVSLLDNVKYVIYDNENRLFKKEYKNVENVVFYWYNDDYYISLGTPAYQRHGLSVLSNLYHSTNLAKTLGYTHFYRIEYDSKLGNTDSIKDVVHRVAQSGKKGLIHVNQNKYVSYQIWYFELEYFTANFPAINTEEDYVNVKQKFNYERDFMTAEEFVYNMIKHSNGGFSNVLVRTAEQMHTDYGNCTWNTITSPSESDKIIDGCVSTIARVTIPNDEVRSMRKIPRPDWTYDPESCPNDTSKVAFVTWNCSSDGTNYSEARLTYPDGRVYTIRHAVDRISTNMYNIIDVIDGDILVEIFLNNKLINKLIINKDNVSNLLDVYQPTHNT